jgi:glycosyl hydrolase family 123
VIAVLLLTARVVGPMVQVFPSSVPPGEPEARLEAARGEWEPFQIVVHAAGAPLRAVTADASPLRGPSAIAAPRLYRVEYLDVKTPSSVEGHAGPWPDALVPDVDGYAGEKRRAFPFDVAAGEARAIWVEVFVPESAAPGRYQGTVRVSAAGSATETIPIDLVVHAFALPKSSSLPVTFGFSAGAIARAHPGLSPAATQALVTRYQIAALRHRVSLHGGSFEPPTWRNVDGKPVLDFAAYDAEVGPFLDGSADRGGPADGARWSAVDLRVPHTLDGAARDEYVRAMVAHLRARGWLERAFDYTSDEPPDDKFADVRARAAALRRATPAVPRLVTHAFDPRLDGSVDIWCPIVNFVDDKAGNSRSPPRALYDKRHARIWWYQACMSHGCNIVGGDYFTGWPSYVVDAPAMSHRIFEWLTFRYRIGGELYYDTVEAYERGLDPWRDQLLFGGNGDGTLFYPGRAAALGGKSDFPVESIRLALIREGLEDYEYLKLYARAAGEKEAEALAATIANKTYQWEHDAGRLMAARHKMAETIDRWVASNGGMGVTAR